MVAVRCEPARLPFDACWRVRHRLLGTCDRTARQTPRCCGRRLVGAERRGSGCCYGSLPSGRRGRSNGHGVGSRRGPSRGCRRRGSGGRGGRARRRGGRSRAQPPGVLGRPDGACRDDRAGSSRRPTAGLATGGLHGVCHSRALRHVRRRDGQRPRGPACVRGAGSEGRLLRVDREPRPRAETESPNHSMLRRPGGGELSIIALVLPASTVERAFRLRGEVTEWSKVHAWKACVGATLPWVRIPPSPPLWGRKTRNAPSGRGTRRGARVVEWGGLENR